MSRLPQRYSLTEQVVQILREDLQAGRWKKYLPGESTLAEQLRVSRRTLRMALAILQREGRIAGSQGRRRRVVSPVSSAQPARTKRVVFLLPAVPMLSPFNIFVTGQLRLHLQSIGWELETRCDPAVMHRNRSLIPALRELVQESGASAWILGGAREEVQRWFKNQRLPTLIFGSTFASVGLPSLDLDFRAVCHHAVGTCLRLGHVRMALVKPRSTLGGHFAMEQGFQEGFAGAHPEPVFPLMGHHDGSVVGICRTLRRLLRPPHRPTALIVADPRHILTVLSYLHGHGLRVPADVGVVAIEYDWFLRDLAFSLAHYEISLERMAGRLARLAVRLATTGTLPARQQLLMPRFVPGDSLAPQ